MTTRKRLMKSTWYSQPHEIINKYGMTLEPSAVAHKNALDIPLIRYNEALGDPASNNTHPEHASFASAAKASCYPDSTISNFFCQIEFHLTKIASNSNIPYKFGLQVISPAFLEDLNPIDEITGISIETTLALEHETTNRQAFSLYSALDAPVPFTGSTTIHADDDEGLTATDLMETTAFNIEQFYDMIQYSSTRKKLLNVQSGIQWFWMFPKASPTMMKVNIHLKSSVKRMNEYATLIARVIVPPVDTYYQYSHAADQTADDIHIEFDVKCRYEEWNEFFDFART